MVTKCGRVQSLLARTIWSIRFIEAAMSSGRIAIGVCSDTLRFFWKARSISSGGTLPTLRRISWRSDFSTLV